MKASRYREQPKLASSKSVGAKLRIKGCERWRYQYKSRDGESGVFDSNLSANRFGDASDQTSAKIEADDSIGSVSAHVRKRRHLMRDKHHAPVGSTVHWHDVSASA